VLGVLLALSLVIVIAGPMLEAPPNDVLLLLVFLASTGTLRFWLPTFVQTGLVSWFRSLRWALLAAIILTVLLIFLNVWVTPVDVFSNSTT